MSKQARESRIASQLAEAKGQGHGLSTVAQLQTYILGNSFIKIYDLDRKSHLTSSDEKACLLLFGLLAPCSYRHESL